MRYHEINDKAYRVLDMTSLTVEEFAHLVPAFETTFVQYMQEWTMEGKRRVARAYTPYTNSPLPTPEDRLLFILTYMKVAALQVAQGALFGMSQSNANKWIQVLLLVLHHTLVDLRMTPARHLHALELRLAALGAQPLAPPATTTASPFFITTAASVPLRAPKTPLNKARIIAARKSDIP